MHHKRHGDSDSDSDDDHMMHDGDEKHDDHESSEDEGWFNWGGSDSDEEEGEHKDGHDAKEMMEELMKNFSDIEWSDYKYYQSQGYDD